MDRITAISDARAHLPEIVSLLSKKKRLRYIITRGGRPSAVIISPEELETLEVLSDKKLMLSLLRAEEDERAGRIVRYETNDGHKATQVEMSHPDWASRLARAQRETQQKKRIELKRYLRKRGSKVRRKAAQ
ncbi:MAG: type II toxin-antitoxin system Phd/YefM family antitoxin [Elusimicrobia bacterium]|nr:type II toxin-antitoxin system Phd/YefM family antitoxin [Candidatus Obscuribacterium magneticum]